MVELDRLHRVALENALQVKEFLPRLVVKEVKKALEVRQGSKHPAVLLAGIRGVGKTTLMLQLFSEDKQAFYFSADSALVKSESLYEIVDEARKQGFDKIFIDEVHKQQKWVDEIKNIYDDFGVQVIASGSSTAAIKKGSLALGRRALEIEVSNLTFSEFIYLKLGKLFTAELEEVLDKKAAVKWLVEHAEVEKYYKEYLRTGGFPFAASEGNAVFKLMRRMIYEDALAEFSLSEKKVDSAEKLLGFLASSKLGEFSYSSFSNTSGYAKTTVFDTAALLKELGILTALTEYNAKAQAKTSAKLLFSHPNLRMAVAGELMREPEIGALREEYFVFHARNLSLPVFLPKKSKKNPDYEVMLDGLNGKKTLFEIGGQSKTNAQFEGKKGFVLDDEKLMVLGFVNTRKPSY